MTRIDCIRDARPSQSIQSRCQCESHKAWHTGIQTQRRASPCPHRFTGFRRLILPASVPTYPHETHPWLAGMDVRHRGHQIAWIAPLCLWPRLGSSTGLHSLPRHKIRFNLPGKSSDNRHSPGRISLRRLRLFQNERVRTGSPSARLKFPCRVKMSSPRTINRHSGWITQTLPSRTDVRLYSKQVRGRSPLGMTRVY